MCLCYQPEESRVLPEKLSPIRTAAVHESWAQTADWSARTAPARQAALDRFEREIRQRFPDLTDAEVAKRAEHLKKAHYLRMAYRSAQVRRAKAAAKRKPTSSEREAS